MSAADSAATPTHTAARGPRRLSRRRRSLYAVITVVFAYVVIESFAWLLMYMAWGGMSAAQSRLVQAAAGGTEGTVDPKIEVVHPFLGYVMHVDNDNYNVQGVQPYSVTDFGLYDAASPLRKRSPDRVIVAITGGSVAHHFSVLAADELAAHLADVYPGRTIEFVRLGLPGYKQPQQLMILTYIPCSAASRCGDQPRRLHEILSCRPVRTCRTECLRRFRSWQYRVVTGNDLSLLRAAGGGVQPRSPPGDFAADGALCLVAGGDAHLESPHEPGGPAIA